MSGEIGAINGQVEVVPLAGGGLRGSAESRIYRDLRMVDTNKSVSSGQAGNFNVTFGVPHGRGLLTEFGLNDVAKISLKRSDDNTPFTDSDVVMVGQIDRASKTDEFDPVKTEWTLRGKDLTKQFLTNTIYVQQINFDDKGNALPIGVTQWSLASVIYELFGCTEGWTQITDTESVPPASFVGLNIQCFLEKLVSNGFYVDPDLLPGGSFIQAQHLLPDVSLNASFMTVATLLDMLVDRPYVHWYVDEVGKFYFKPWQWRDATPQQIIYDGDLMNSHLSWEDFNIVTAVSIMPQVTQGAEGTLGIAVNNNLGQRFGMRHSALQNVPYLYTPRMARQRATDHIHQQYLSALGAVATLHGGNHWKVDQYAYWERQGGYWYVDGVQHRWGTDDSPNWSTTLNLTHGRATPDAFADATKAEAQIAVDMGQYIVPVSYSFSRPVFPLQSEGKIDE